MCGQRIGLLTRRTRAALSGAGLLAVLVTGVSLTTRLLVTPVWLQPLFSAGLAVALALALLRWQASWVLSADLRDALRAHADGLRLAGAICRFARLNKGMP